MESLERIGSLSEISPVELALAILIVGLTIVAGFASFLWTRWMTRQETRIDRVEQRQWDMLERVSTKDDLHNAIRHLDDRLDRLENRIDYGAAGMKGAAE